MADYKLQAAELLIRCFAGILFFFQGYDKLARVKMAVVIDTFMEDATRHHVPKFFVVVISYFTSIVELVGGLLLISGLFTHLALYALGIDLLVVCFAFSFVNPMWDLKHLFPRLIFVTVLLFFPTETTYWCLDELFKTN